MTDYDHFKEAFRCWAIEQHLHDKPCQPSSLEVHPYMRCEICARAERHYLQFDFLAEHTPSTVRWMGIPIVVDPSLPEKEFIFKDEYGNVIFEGTIE